MEEEGDLASWGDDFATTIALLALAYYLLGRGGLSQMQQADWDTVVAEVNGQYIYLAGFADDITGGDLSKAQINARTGLYLASVSQLYHLGRGNAFGLILPGYPGVGTDCHMNCKCWWRIVEYDDRWEAFWERTAAESCPTCISRSSLWYPYIAYK